MRWLLLIVILGCQSPTDFGKPPVNPGVDPCGLVTCESANASCGPIGDGCGLTVQCGDCGDSEICGGSGTSFTCAPNPCVPRTCADVGANCGRIADGCGGLTANCGTCEDGEACGVGATANVCAVPPCVGLCLQQNACGTTKITGKVTAPGHASGNFGPPDPIFGALVFVPNGGPAPNFGVEKFSAGVACESCASVVTGTPLVTATTAADGTFTIENAPCGTNIPLVIQLGRWRRQISIPSVACCATTALTNNQTHLPRSRQGEPGDVRSDIPLIAVSTGAADTLHCVLRKIGIDDDEFTNPSGNGRVRLYQDNGARLNGSTPPATSLYGSFAELDDYDMVLFECVGDRQPKEEEDQKRIIKYANAGGRVFATHFSYVWLTDSDGTEGTNTGPKPWSQTASWAVDQLQLESAVGIVDESVQGDPLTQARRTAFADWLLNVGASTQPGRIPVNVVRKDFDAVSAVPGTATSTPAQRWMFSDETPLSFTFDTPIAYPPFPKPNRQCGRVLYNDFHVSDSMFSGSTFPTECSDTPMTPQEKTLEFMLFDLASCVGPPRTTCSPKTCEQLGLSCGLSGDGCDDGIVLECGDCTNGQFCGGGGPGVCGNGPCVPRTCADANANCGVIGDGCGGTVECGDCTDGTTCGGGGDSVPNVCGIVLL